MSFAPKKNSHNDKKENKKMFFDILKINSLSNCVEAQAIFYHCTSTDFLYI
jgi:predicted transcriptional regulator